MKYSKASDDEVFFIILINELVEEEVGVLKIITMKK